MKNRKLLFIILIIVTVFLSACNIQFDGKYAYGPDNEIIGKVDESGKLIINCCVEPDDNIYDMRTEKVVGYFKGNDILDLNGNNIGKIDFDYQIADRNNGQQTNPRLPVPYNPFIKPFISNPARPHIRP